MHVGRRAFKLLAKKKKKNSWPGGAASLQLPACLQRAPTALPQLDSHPESRTVSGVHSIPEVPLSQPALLGGMGHGADALLPLARSRTGVGAWAGPPQKSGEKGVRSSAFPLQKHRKVPENRSQARAPRPVSEPLLCSPGQP